MPKKVYPCPKCDKVLKSESGRTLHVNAMHLELSPNQQKQAQKAQIVRDAKGKIVKGVAQDTNKNGTAGRPTEYTDDIPEKMIAYFTVTEFYRREVKSESTGKNDFSKTEYMIVPNDLPTMEGFAKQLGVTAKTLWAWQDELLEDGETYRRPDFRKAYMRAQDMQKEMLVTNGLAGLYNPKFAVFVAQNFTEMRDKTAIDHTTQGDKIVVPNVYLPEDLPDDWFEQRQAAEAAKAAQADK